MKHPLILSSAKVIAAVALILGTPLALANDVNWSVTIGSPYPAPQVYSPPPRVVYVQPQPVYVRPHPVVVQSGPVIYYDQPYYVTERRHKKSKHYRHWKRHHHDDYDD
jgi:hypothetical protein